MAVLIIAEAGVNHNGSLETAKQMAAAAKKAGADVVKFQTCIPKEVASRFAPKADYQKQQTGSSESQLEMIRKLHFDFESHRHLKCYCEQIGIQYLSTAFDLPSVDFLVELDLAMHKIPSGEITNLPYLEKLAQTGLPLLLSTGMCEMEEISEALAVLRKNGAGPVTLLHCNTQYPTPDGDANVLAMNALRDFGCPVGYSDHTSGIDADIAAVALGACVIEKHFTLDKNMPGPDQKASLSVEELTAMCSAIRRTEQLLGKAEKHITASELPNRAVARKSIVANRAIIAGETFTTENLGVKRPGYGISPMHWYEVLGQKAKRDFQPDELIEL